MAKIVNKYPVGIQTFEKIRENGYLYIDKTKNISWISGKSRCRISF